MIKKTTQDLSPEQRYNYLREEYKALSGKNRILEERCKKLNEIEEFVGEFYDDEEPEGDLLDIGEGVARILGYL